MAQDTRDRRRDEDDSDGEGTAGPAGRERGAHVGQDVDAMLEVIDEVLEEHAGEFVQAYVQHGGQ